MNSRSIGPPVLVLAFRRPALLRRTLEALRDANPSRVYVSIDGPRLGSETDEQLVLQTVNVAAEFEWSCPTQIMTSASNGGVGLGVVRGISWFFSHEEAGMVLEDDVLIEPGSLELASALLRRFEDDSSVGSVSLFNPVPRSRLSQPNDALRLSRIPSSQYWGTWRDRWEQLPAPEADLREVVPTERLKSLAGGHFAAEWSRTIEHASRRGTISWEHRWLAVHWQKCWYSVTSTANYSTHLGFGPEATNSHERPSWYPRLPEPWVGMPQLSPPQVDGGADDWLFNQRFGLSPSKRVKRRLATHLPWVKRAWRRVLD